MHSSNAYAKCLLVLSIIGCFAGLHGRAQIDPEYRDLLELGFDQPLIGQGPPGEYAYLYYYDPRMFNLTHDCANWVSAKRVAS
jgi:hypothetical protein